MSLKIVLLTHFYPPSPCGGGGIFAAKLAKALQQSSYDVCVLCAGNWDKGAKYFNGYVDEVYQGIPVRRLNVNWSKAPRPFDYLFDNPVLAQEIQDYLQKVQPDVAHVISCYTLSAQAILVPKLLGIPTVVHLLDMWFICPNHTLLRKDGNLCYGSKGDWDCQSCLLWDSKAYRWSGRLLGRAQQEWLFKQVSRYGLFTRLRGLRGMLGDVQRRRKFVLDALLQADAIIAPSLALRSLYEANGVPAGYIRYIPHGYSTAWAKSVKRQKSSVVRFGFLGNVIPIKGVHILIAAFEEIAKQHQAELHIFGYARDNDSYIARLKRRDIPQVTWHGEYNHADLPNVFGQVDVLVFPSIWHENNPLVIQEAFAAGCPVICSDVAGAAEHVDNQVNGLHFRVGDAIDLAQKMLRIVTEPDLLERLRANIKPVRSIEEELADITHVYQQVIGRC